MASASSKSCSARRSGHVSPSASSRGDSPFLDDGTVIAIPRPDSGLFARPSKRYPSPGTVTMSRGCFESSSIFRRSFPTITSTLRSNGSKRRLTKVSSKASRLRTLPGRVTNTRKSANSPRVSGTASPVSRTSVRASRSRIKPAKRRSDGASRGCSERPDSGASRMGVRPNPGCLFTSDHHDYKNSYRRNISWLRPWRSVGRPSTTVSAAYKVAEEAAKLRAP